MGISVDFAFPADDPEDDTELQAKNRETLALCGDIDVIPGLYNTAGNGPNTQQLYCLIYDLPTDRDLEIAVERFQSENPGDTSVLGAWYVNNGSPVGTEPVYDTRIVEKTWSVLNPDYQPDPNEPNYDPRFVLRITGDVEETYMSGFTGTPLYNMPGNVRNFMPYSYDENGDQIPNSNILRDVHLYGGQVVRFFY